MSCNGILDNKRAQALASFSPIIINQKDKNRQKKSRKKGARAREKNNLFRACVTFPNFEEKTSVDGPLASGSTHRDSRSSVRRGCQSRCPCHNAPGCSDLPGPPARHARRSKEGPRAARSVARPRVPESKIQVEARNKNKLSVDFLSPNQAPGTLARSA